MSRSMSQDDFWVFVCQNMPANRHHLAFHKGCGQWSTAQNKKERAVHKHCQNISIVRLIHYTKENRESLRTNYEERALFFEKMYTLDMKVPILIDFECPKKKKKLKPKKGFQEHEPLKQGNITGPYVYSLPQLDFIKKNPRKLDISPVVIREN